MERMSHRSSSREIPRERRVRPTPEQQVCSTEQQRIRDWLRRVKFRKAVFGGVRESDVWKKIEELNTMYEAALAAERMRYDTLLKERVPAVAQMMANQMVQSARQKKAGDGQYGQVR